MNIKSIALKFISDKPVGLNVPVKNIFFTERRSLLILKYHKSNTNNIL